MDCKVVFENKEFNGKTYEVAYLVIDGIMERIQLRDYIAIDKLKFVKSILGR